MTGSRMRAGKRFDRFRRGPLLVTAHLFLLVLLAATGIISGTRDASASFDVYVPGLPGPGPQQCVVPPAGVCIVPSLTISENGAWWPSYSAYVSRQLSVSFTINHLFSGFCTNVVGTINNNGVSTLSPMPIQVGNLDTYGSVPVVIKYNVPVGVTYFHTRVYVTSENACTFVQFPGPYPGG